MGMIAVILVGFAMITLGMALLILGEVPFVAGKRIPAWRSRLIGAVLVLYLPIACGAWIGMTRVFTDYDVDGIAVTWGMFTLAWLGVAMILFRVMVPKKERRAARGTAAGGIQKANPFGGEPQLEDPVEEVVEAEEPEPAPAPVKKPPAKKPTPAPAPAPKKAPRKAIDDNPFDFS